MKNYRNTAFLIELLVNVLVLSISCAVLVQVLVHAALVVRDTGRKNAAGNEISTLLETARVEGVASIGGEENGLNRTLYYDEDWHPASEAEATFVLTFAIEEETTAAGVLHHVEARADDMEGSEICEFSTSLYQPGEEVAV